MENKTKRYYSCELRSSRNDNGTVTIEGMPIVFETMTDIGPFNEIIDRSAFDDPNTLRDVALFVQHNDSMIPLARSRNNNENSTMRLRVLEEGVGMEADIDVARNADAAALDSALDRGDITGMSFAFIVPKDGDEWDWTDKKHPTRRIKKVGRVFEVSAVSEPAYRTTNIQARQADTEALESARAVLESAEAEERERIEAQEREALRAKIKILCEV